jgi:hypothetical protein
MILQFQLKHKLSNLDWKERSAKKSTHLQKKVVLCANFQTIACNLNFRRSGGGAGTGQRRRRRLAAA